MRLIQRLRIWRDRLVLNLYPPYFLSGTRCAFVAPDYRTVRMELPLTILTRNLHGSHFGGSIYAMTDPVYALMLVRLLGPGHTVWARSAAIDFRKPGRGTISAVFHVTDEDLAAVRESLAANGKTVQRFHADVLDRQDDVVAAVDLEVYVRRT